MNFLGASLLWHCHEEYAFFILIKIFEKLEMEKIYTHNLSGVEDKI